MTRPNHSLVKTIYLAIRKARAAKISEILHSLNLDTRIELKSIFSRDSILKLLVFSKLKGIRSHVKLSKFLNAHPDDAIALGFCRDSDDKIRVPDRRSIEYFVNKKLTKENEELISFIVKTIEEVADKTGIVLDREIMQRKTTAKNETACDKTILDRRTKRTEELCAEVKRLLLKRLRFDMHKNAFFKDSDLLDLLIHIALTQDFAENGSKTLNLLRNHRIPNSDTLFYHLKKTRDFDESRGVFMKIFDTVFKLAKRSGLIIDRKVDVAIDSTEWFYYGDHGHPMVVGKKPERGTTWCFKFITLDIVERGERFTLLALPVSSLDNQTNRVEELINYAKERVHINRAYLDRGFLSAECINRLKKLGVTFIIPTKDNTKAVSSARGLKPPFIVKDCKMAECTYNLIMVEEDHKRHGFVTNMGLNANDVMFAKEIANLYRKRWQIETGYRVKALAFRGKTTSRNYLIRYFYFMLSVVLYNLWLFVDMLVIAFLGLRAGKTLVSAKQFGTILMSEKEDSGG